MAARKHREINDIQPSEKTIPFVTCEVSLGQYVGELVFGVNIFDMDLGVRIDSVEYYHLRENDYRNAWCRFYRFSN